MKITRRRAVELMFLSPLAAMAQDVNAPQGKKKGPRGQQGGQKGGHGPDQKNPSTFYTDVPGHDFDIILGRPTRTSITASVLFYADVEAYIAIEGHDASKTPVQQLKSGVPAEFTLTDLTAGRTYAYRLFWRAAGTSTFTAYGPREFHLPKPRGDSFTYTIVADSHLDYPDAPRLYPNTLRSVIADKPDFHIDLGDTFMTDKRGQDYTAARAQYIAQRYYLGLIGEIAPVYLVLGNHDGETGARFNGQTDSMPGWSNAMRKQYFPNPRPNEFYSGNDQAAATLGQLEDYYAWEWGNALFVVLDPYWFTVSHSKGPGAYWERSLGEKQYRWLATVLARSKAPFKFVFIHNLVGGVDESMRGGAEAARLYEWGGHEPDGKYAFAEQRPQWKAPIHTLLKTHGVNVVFHGHDHFFAHQEYDGVVYQTLPQPATPGNRSAAQMAAEYGYVSGTFLASPGYLRVTVGQDEAQVVFISTGSDKPTAAFAYTLKAAQPRAKGK